MLYLLLADGFEETEAIAPLDILRRAEIPVKTVAVTENPVCGAHGIPVTADLTLEEADISAAEGVILPGGMPGTLNLQKSPKVIALLEAVNQKKGLIGAICAAPMIPGSLGMLDGRNAVCFPGFEDQMESANILDANVVTDGHFITARGAGAALEFGGAMVDFIRRQQGKSEKGGRLLAQMQFHYEPKS